MLMAWHGAMKSMTLGKKGRGFAAVRENAVDQAAGDRVPGEARHPPKKRRRIHATDCEFQIWREELL
jgi:hypothetical protein